MKKNKQGKENKRNGNNLFKYVQPQHSTLHQQSKLHSRSLIELDNNTSRYQQSARVPSNKQNHHSSLCAPIEQHEADTVKSHSLKKFLSIFGGPAHLNQSSNIKSNVYQQKSTSKGSGRQVFTCNIKNMNVNMASNKEKLPKQSNTMILTKRDKNDTLNSKTNTKKNEEYQLIQSLRKSLNEGKQRQNILKAKIQNIEDQNKQLKQELQATISERQTFEHQCEQRQQKLQQKIQALERALSSREKCREHQLIIQSLKKVINQQLKKIIQLQKLKIQREEIEKLEERINKNINIANQNSNKQKLRMLQSQELIKVKRKDAKNIRIQEDRFSQTSVSTPTDQHQIYSDTIEQAPSQEERDSSCPIEETEEDSILEEVDRYLTQWRLKC